MSASDSAATSPKVLSKSLAIKRLVLDAIFTNLPTKSAFTRLTKSSKFKSKSSIAPFDLAAK